MLAREKLQDLHKHTLVSSVDVGCFHDVFRKIFAPFSPLSAVALLMVLSILWSCPTVCSHQGGIVLQRKEKEKDQELVEEAEIGTQVDNKWRMETAQTEKTSTYVGFSLLI